MAHARRIVGLLSGVERGRFFLHWSVDASLVRPLVPAGLSLHLLNGSAWVFGGCFHDAAHPTAMGARISARFHLSGNQYSDVCAPEWIVRRVFSEHRSRESGFMCAGPLPVRVTVPVFPDAAWV